MGDIDFTTGVVVDPGYYNWQYNRIKFVIEKYGKDFFVGKKVLELGCFEGGISQMLFNLGAKLTSIEGFERNINVCKNRYSHLDFILKDLDVDNWDFEDHYDIIIHWGLLYHLRYPEVSIKHCVSHCDYLFLESLVVDCTSEHTSHVPEKNQWGTDQSIHEVGSRFSPKYVESLFAELPYIRYDDPKLNSNHQPHYDNNEGNTWQLQRKFWVIDCKQNQSS